MKKKEAIVEERDVKVWHYGMNVYVIGKSLERT